MYADSASIMRVWVQKARGSISSNPVYLIKEWHPLGRVYEGHLSNSSGISNIMRTAPHALQI